MLAPSLLLYGFISVVALDDLPKNEKCINPYSNNGTCVPVYECPEVYKASTSKYNIDFLFATKSYCGYDEEVLVCCEHPDPVELTNIDINYILGNKECGIVKQHFRVDGVERAGIGEFPWVVAIDYELKRDKRKVWLEHTGSLINDQYVLTAAYFLEDPHYDPIFVILGESDFSTDPDCAYLVGNKFCADPAKIVGIKETILHPFYNRRFRYNNIGLIRLEEKVTFTDFIAPICLPHSNSVGFSEAKEEFTYLVSWWTPIDTRIFSEFILRKRRSHVLQENLCREYMTGRRYRNVTDRHLFCTYSVNLRKSNDCELNYYGGPIMKSYDDESNGVVWYIHGMPIEPDACDPDQIRTLAVNVTDYVDWILKTVISYSKTGL